MQAMTYCDFDAWLQSQIGSDFSQMMDSGLAAA
jgi:hypothetical protein